MKALVTGASGFIGSHLVELLLRQDYNVRVLLRSTSSTTWLQGLPVDVVYGDIFDHEALGKAVTGVEYVYHSAGLTKARTAEEYFRANTTGTRNLLEACLRHNSGIQRFVQISSQTAAGPSASARPVTESDEPRPITTYGHSKLRAEEECLRVAASIPVTIVRPPAVYGPRDKDIFEFFNTMQRGLQPMVGFREKYVSLIHVSDLARGIVMAGLSPASRGQTYFLSSREVYGWKQVGDITRTVLGTRPLRVHVPVFGVYTIAAFAELFAAVSRKPALINFEKARDMVQDYWTCDGSRAYRDFGFQQEISLEEGIRTTIDWYKSHGWLR
jgi:nucleoside-diphosphate-sugar epimerase